MREAQHEGFFKNYKKCPKCRGKFTVDRDTKIRQGLFIIIAIISLVITVLMYFEGSAWVTPAIASYIVLVVLIYWGNKKVILVRYTEELISHITRRPSLRFARDLANRSATWLGRYIF